MVMGDGYDVAVVGAGPAGTAAAITAAEHGLRTVCLDRATFPRDKTCGDGLTANALRLLERLGIGRNDLELTPVTETVLVTPNGHRIELPMGVDGLHGAVVRRIDLDAAMVALARRRGVELREGCEVEKVVVHDDGVQLDDVFARHVIAADGHWSSVRRALEPDAPRDLGEWHAVRQYFEGVADDRLFVLFERDLLPGYVWVFPLGNGRANVGYGVLRSDGRTGKELKALWPELLERPTVRAILGPDARAIDNVRAWPIPTRYSPDRLTHGARVFFAGDTAGVVDPMTGEGIAQAIETGMLAAEAIATGADYRTLVAHSLGNDLRFAGWLQRVLARPWGARATLAVVDVSPWTRRNFARWMWEDYPRAVVGTPSRWQRDVFRAPGAWNMT
jgi:geranylgeranyl reductase family protein